MIVKLSKKYKTKDGENVRIYTVSGGSERYPVIGEIESGDGEFVLMKWALDGRLVKDNQSGSDLVEVHQCADLKHGDAVMVWNCSRGSRKYERRFIGYTDAGAVYASDDDGLVTLWSFGKPV